MAPKRKIVKKRTASPATVYKNDYESIDHMASAVRGVMKSLTDKDGYYDVKEADTIGNIFGKQVNLMKVKLEAYKMTKGDAALQQKLIG
jgi:hypothetical protein